MLATELRLLRIETLGRLRRLGWWPWLVLGGWILYAGAQEPRLLRGFGINLCWEASWSGGIVVLLGLAGQGGTGMPPRNQLLRTVNMMGVGALLALLVGLVHAVLAWLVDATVAPPTPVTAVLGQAAGFALLCWPLAVALAFAVEPRTHPAARLLLALPAAFSIGASAIWFRAPTLALALACILAAVGAACIGGVSARVETAAAARRSSR
jgi:hypothetical protein